MRRNTIFFLILLLTILTTYWPVVREGKVLQFDDTEIFKPMHDISSISDYVNKVEAGIIIDRQPLRDFSYWIDHKLSPFGWQPQFSNIVIWFFCLILSYLLAYSLLTRFLAIQLESKNLELLRFCTLIVCVHPMAVNSVAWIASRKHLLSALFTLGFLLLCSEKWGRLKKIDVWVGNILFLGACLSQPGNLLWPFFIASLWILNFWRVGSAHFSQDSNQRLKLMLLCPAIAISCITFWVNWRYYSGSQYLDLLGDVNQLKVIPEKNVFMADRFLAIGRYFFQVLIPIRPSIFSYEINNVPSFIGLMVSPIVVWIFVKKLGMRTALICLAALSVPLVPTIVRVTHHRGWDTYFLTSLLLIPTLMSVFFLRVRGRSLNSELGGFNIRFSQVGLVVICIVFACYSRYQSSFWKSDLLVWQRAVELEPTPVTLGNYARVLITSSADTTLPYQIADKLLASSPKLIGLGYIYSRSVYGHPDMSTEVKITKLQENFPEDPWSLYYQAVFFAKSSSWQKANELIYKAWIINPRRFVIVFGEELPEVVANWFVICKSALMPDTLNPSECNDLVERARSSASKKFWNEDRFLARLKKHGVQNL